MLVVNECKALKFADRYATAFRDQRMSTEDQKNTQTRFHVRRFVLTYTRPYLKVLLSVVAISQIVEGFEAIFLREVLNTLSKDDSQKIALLFFSGILVCRLVSLLGYTIFHEMEARYSPRIQENIKSTLFKHALNNSHFFYEKSKGSKVAHAIDGIAKSTVLIMYIVCFELWRPVVIVSFSALILTTVQPWLAGIATGWFVIYLSGSIMLAKRAGSMARSSADATQKCNDELVDSLESINIVKAFQGAKYELDRYRKILQLETLSNTRYLQFAARSRAFKAITVTALLGALGGWTLYAVPTSKVDIGAIAMIFGLCSIITLQVWTLSNRFFDITHHWALLDQLLKNIIELPARDRTNIVPVSTSDEIAQMNRIAIQLKNLSYRHHTSGMYIYENLHLAIIAGERVGIVGPSGGGKTTLLNLLKREIHPTEGEIWVCGKNIANMDSDQVAVFYSEVRQQAQLFNRTIKENVMYGRDTFLDEDFYKVMADACCNSERLRSALEVVGKNGDGLSGGEKQRVAVARALAKDSPILLLDEATSALDALTEKAIIENVLEAQHNKTIIVVAHRLTVMARMDRVIYVDKGRIIEQGTHEGLLAAGGAYSDLWNAQGQYSVARSM